MTATAFALLLLIAVPVAAGTAQGARPTTVRAPEAWVRVQGDVTGMSAGYFTIQNTGASPVVVRAVTCRDIRMVSVHESVVTNGMVRMTPRDSVVVAAGQQVVMRPGGLHLMLMGLARPLSVGDRVSCVLRTSAGDVPVEAAVRAG